MKCLRKFRVVKKITISQSSYHTRSLAALQPSLSLELQRSKTRPGYRLVVHLYICTHIYCNYRAAHSLVVQLQTPECCMLSCIDGLLDDCFLQHCVPTTKGVKFYAALFFFHELHYHSYWFHMGHCYGIVCYSSVVYSLSWGGTKASPRLWYEASAPQSINLGSGSSVHARQAAFTSVWEQ